MLHACDCKSEQIFVIAFTHGL